MTVYFPIDINECRFIIDVFVLEAAMTAATPRREAQTEPHPDSSPRSVVLSAAVSLDGYIARQDGALDWPIMDREIDLGAYVKAFDVIVAGRKTLAPQPALADFQGMGRVECYVFSRTLPPGKRDGVEYVNQTPSELISQLRARPGKDIWLMGGGELAREFLKEDPQRNFALVKFQAYETGVVMASYERVSAKPAEKA
jgi:dihydrofolate reductase